jgi:hypothetical protein
MENLEVKTGNPGSSSQSPHSCQVNSPAHRPVNKHRITSLRNSNAMQDLHKNPTILTRKPYLTSRQQQPVVNHDTHSLENALHLKSRLFMRLKSRTDIGCARRGRHVGVRTKGLAECGIASEGSRAGLENVFDFSTGVEVRYFSDRSGDVGQPGWRP